MEDSCGNGSMEVSSHCNGVKIEDEIVANFDSYFEDVDDCLTISRMVNDSVIKGMVNAVTEEAAEKIALKEQEVASLKKRLEFYESGCV
ncbi:hypothetical protein IFM89_017619 [Coptis chinensis]|uniref:Uncharacterized protein n=1 Tax=Coptis chinensis TaxID=261450 RepID=A0A835LC21_9MAGN|nr:hypothetical protein IFM89_017619 [Coptis chinensis]